MNIWSGKTSPFSSVFLEFELRESLQTADGITQLKTKITRTVGDKNAYLQGMCF